MYLVSYFVWIHVIFSIQHRPVIYRLTPSPWEQLVSKHEPGNMMRQHACYIATMAIREIILCRSERSQKSRTEIIRNVGPREKNEAKATSFLCLEQMNKCSEPCLIELIFLEQMLNRISWVLPRPKTAVISMVATIMLISTYMNAWLTKSAHVYKTFFLRYKTFVLEVALR